MAPALFLIIVFCVLPVLTGRWEQNLGPLQRGIVFNLFLASELSPQLPCFPFSEGCCCSPKHMHPRLPLAWF